MGGTSAHTREPRPRQIVGAAVHPEYAQTGECRRGGGRPMHVRSENMGHLESPAGDGKEAHHINDQLEVHRTRAATQVRRQPPPSSSRRWQGQGRRSVSSGTVPGHLQMYHEGEETEANGAENGHGNLK